jgi:DNA-binding MarR family transcriptional regulator
MTQKKWLDADEQRVWIGLIATFTLLDAALDRQLQRDSELSHAQYGMLSMLSEAPDHTMHMSQLAVLTSSSQSRLSHAISRLEEEGWVVRNRCPSNKRAVHATLTDKGYALVRAAAPGHVAEVRRLFFDHLSREQVDQLGAITAKTLQALADDGYEPPTLGEPRPRSGT